MIDFLTLAIANNKADSKINTALTGTTKVIHVQRSATFTNGVTTINVDLSAYGDNTNVYPILVLSGSEYCIPAESTRTEENHSFVVRTFRNTNFSGTISLDIFIFMGDFIAEA